MMMMMNEAKQFDKANVRLTKQMYESKLLDMDKQIVSSIQTQVVETSRALELLKSSYADILGINENFQQIDDKCLQCQKYLSQFDQIKKLSLARNNLHITNKIGRLFREVPKKAKQLLTLLHDNPDKYLFYVYKNLRKLVKLRDETLSKGLQYMKNEEDEMKNHFKLIDSVAFSLEQEIRFNIADALVLAVDQPEILVETLKICESEDRGTKKTSKILCYSRQDWSKWREKEQEQKDQEAQDEEVRAPPSSEDTMRDKVKAEILSGILGLTERLQHEKEQGIKAFLTAIDDHMKDLDIVNEQLRITFPPSYAIVPYYVSYYYKFLQPLILAQLSSENVPTQERLFVVAWIAKFKLSVRDLEKQMLKYGDSLEAYSQAMILNLSDQEEALLDSYMKTCRDKLASWIGNIVENESSKREYFMVDKVPRTHCPQDLFTALNHQFTIATQQLRGTPFVSVIGMILEAMDLFKSLLETHIVENCGEFDDEYFCAMLNSCYDVSQKLKEKSDAILDQPDLYRISDADITNLENQFDDRICLFTNLGKHCAVLLAHKIFNDVLRENVFAVMWSDAYLKRTPDENEEMRSLVLTLSEFFDDFKQWIEEAYFYWEMVKGAVHIITDEYIACIVSKKPNMDSERLAQYARADIKVLDEFFGNDEQFGDIKKLWHTKSKILDAIPGALECELGFFDSIAKPLFANNDKLVKYIRSLRKKKEKKDKQEMAASAIEDEDEQEQRKNKTIKKFKQLITNK